MGLLTQIQNDAIDDAVPPSTILRKCLLLANNLEIEVLEDWVKWELNGYPDDVEVPEYRCIPMNFRVSGANAAWKITGQPVAPALIEEASENPEISIFKCRQAIGTISVDPKNLNKALHVSLDNLAIIVQHRIVGDSYVVSQFWGEIAASKLYGVIDAVRNRVLELVLRISKQFPNADEVNGLIEKTPTEERALAQTFNTTIYGSAGVVGAANNSTVNVTVNSGNFRSLRNELIRHGIEEEDLSELELAVKADPQVALDKKFGPKVTTWVAKMLGKAAAGGWNMSLGAGGALLEKALLSYYGYN
ncbi:hypothetical protein ABIA16_004216 [Sinorhizobium fredii]